MTKRLAGPFFVLLASALGLSCAPPRSPSAGPPVPVSVAKPALRLPATTRPTRYAVDLTLDPSAETFRGRIAIDLVFRESTRTFWINATDLTLERATLVVDGVERAAAIAAADADFTSLTLPAPVPAGSYRLVVSYTGALDGTRSRGLYREKEGDRWYIYSFFEPIDARRAFPCFDEPDFKVPWALTLHVPRSDVALANAPMASETDGPDGKKTVVFAESKPLPSYAVALVVGPFDLVERPDGPGGKPLRIALPKGRGDEARYAAAHTTSLVRHLEAYFDMPYPYEKLDVAVVPRYWGTMEHPGLVALGQPLTLIRAGEETAERRRQYANIAVHELAHYWFGDLVTMRWWDDTWLNEAFASWLDEKMTDAIDASWGFGYRRLAVARQAMVADGLESAKAVRQPVRARSDIGASFDNETTYSKGAAVVRMVERWMGPPRFRAVLQQYMRVFAWKNASSEDLYALLEAEQPGVTAVMRSFIEQPGLPLVRLDVRCAAGRAPQVTLAQSRFLSVPASGEGEAERTSWSIPVCFAYARGSDPRGPRAEACAVLDQARVDVDLAGAKECPAWVVGNDDASGYYRVAYAPEARRRLDAAPPEAFTARERLSLLDDDDAEAAAGMTPAGAVLAALRGSARDGDPRVAGVAAQKLVALEGHLGPTLHDAFAALFRDLFGLRARALGFVDRAADDEDTKSLRRALLWAAAVVGKDDALAREARRLTLAWLDDREALHGETIGTLLEITVATGDRATFDRVVAEARKTSDRRERGLLLSALGAARDPVLARAALDVALRDAFDPRESSRILRRMAWSPSTRNLSFEAFLTSFEALAARLRDDELSGLFAVVATACDEAHRARAEAALKLPAQRHDGAPLALRNALAAITRCAAEERILGPALAASLAPR